MTAAPTPHLATPIQGVDKNVRLDLVEAKELRLYDGHARFDFVPVRESSSGDADSAEYSAKVEDVILVRSDITGSVKVLGLSKVMGASVTAVDVGNSEGEAIVDSSIGRWFLKLELVLPESARERPAVVVAFGLPLVDVSLQLKRFESPLRLLDWNGDGKKDPLLEYKSDSGESLAAVYLFDGGNTADGHPTTRDGADDRAVPWIQRLREDSNTARLPGVVRVGRQVGSMDEASVLIDLDGDDVAEMVVPDGHGHWQSQRWDGTRFVEGVGIADKAQVPISITREALPALPANLVFPRDGVLYAWPAEGGALVALATENGGDENGLQLSSFSVGGLDYRPYAFGNSPWIAYRETQQDASKPSKIARTAIVVREVGTARRHEVIAWAEDRQISDLTISGNGRWVTFLDDDCDVGRHERDHSTPSTSDVVCRGTWYVVDAEARGPARALGKCMEHWEREAQVRCQESLSDPTGNRLLWGDDDGLWLVDLPDGMPRQLTGAQSITGSVAIDGDDFEPLQHPEMWSSDGRWMVTEGPAGYEGSNLRLWDMTSLRLSGHVGFRYHGRYDLGWNLSSTGGTVPLIETADQQADVMQRGPITDHELPSTSLLGAVPGDPEPVNEWRNDLALWGWSPGIRPRTFSPVVTEEGLLAFGLQHSSDLRYLGNAIMAAPFPPTPVSGTFTLAPRPIVTLPAIGDCDVCDDYEGQRLGTLTWSPDGSAWVFQGFQPASQDDPYGSRAFIWVGLTNGTAVWDATGVITDFQNLAWIPAAGGRHER